MLHLCDTSFPPDPFSPYPSTFPQHDGTAPEPKSLPIPFPCPTDTTMYSSGQFSFCPPLLCLTDTHKVLTVSQILHVPLPCPRNAHDGFQSLPYKHAQGPHRVGNHFYPPPLPFCPPSLPHKHAQGAHRVMEARRAPGQCEGEAERLGTAVRAANLHTGRCREQRFQCTLALLSCSGQTAKRGGSRQKRISASVRAADMHGGGAL